MSICVVMPAYNEEGCLLTVVQSWLRVLNEVDGSIIIVDDGSTDGSAKILDSLANSDQRVKIFHQPNQGHGAAVLRGYREAIASGAEWIFQTDSDDQISARDFFLLWPERSSSAFVLGFRYPRSDALHRRVISKLMKYTLLLFFGTPLRDANIPFRLMKAELVSKLIKILPPAVFAPNIFLSVVAKASGAKVAEIRVPHLERKTGKASISGLRLLQLCLRSVQELVAFRFFLFTRGRAIAAVVGHHD